MLCILAMVTMVFGNVVLGYGFDAGITISDEMSRYCFISLTYIAAMVVMREKGHLGGGHGGQIFGLDGQEGLLVFN